MRMSEDKICQKNLCWLLRTVVGSRCALVTIDSTLDGSGSCIWTFTFVEETSKIIEALSIITLSFYIIDVIDLHLEGTPNLNPKNLSRENTYPLRALTN